MVVANPEDRPALGTIDVDAADAYVNPRQRVKSELAGLGIKPVDEVAAFSAHPDVAVPVGRYVIRLGERSRDVPFLKAFCLGIEHRDLVHT